MTVVAENEHALAEVDPSRRIVIITRKPTRPELPELTAALRTLFREVRPEYQGWGLVLDLRAAPGRNEPYFEQGLQRLRTEADDVFSRVVLLIRTAAGRLQVQRVAREAGRAQWVTDDEATAKAWAAGDRTAVAR